jgi:CubicO group peptidase (beta-lactamase class C family)
MLTIVTPVVLAVGFATEGSVASCTAPPDGQTVAIAAVTAAMNNGSAPAISRAVVTHWASADTSSAVRSRALSQLGVEAWKSRGWRFASPCASGPRSAFITGENALSLETDSLVFTFDDAVKVSGLAVWTGVRVNIPASDTSSARARVAALGRYVARFREAGVFSGVVLVRQGGKTLFADSTGEEQRGLRRRIGVDSRINIASVGKLFTATSAVQLIAKGALSLDDSLGRFYADSELAPPLRPIRIRHLLSHKSGIRDSRTAVASAPGSEYFYSNLEFVILGEVIERVSGERFEDYFAEHLFRPAGMTRTGRPILTKPVDWLAMGYVPQFADSGVVLAANPLLHTLPGNPAGALFSSAQDLARFAEALITGVLVPKQLLDSMRTPRNSTSRSQYGYGVMLWRAPQIWGHGGDLPGTDADLEVFEPSQVIAVVLSNFSGVNNPIRRRIAALWGIVAR